MSYLTLIDVCCCADKIEVDHFIVEYAKVQSWSWNNQYNLKDPGQTFEAVLYRTGDVMMQYLDTCMFHGMQ